MDLLANGYVTFPTASEDMRYQEHFRTFSLDQEIDKAINELIVCDLEAKQVLAIQSPPKQQATDIQTNEGRSSFPSMGQGHQIQFGRRRGVNHEPHVIAEPNLAGP